MKIRINILPENKKRTIELDSGSTVHDIIEKIHFKPDEVIVLNDKVPVPIDYLVNDEQELEILRVASGG